eukprot:8147724-Alexandrium_andersonii.AAC.1
MMTYADDASDATMPVGGFIQSPSHPDYAAWHEALPITRTSRQAQGKWEEDHAVFFHQLGLT